MTELFPQLLSSIWHRHITMQDNNYITYGINHVWIISTILYENSWRQHLLLQSCVSLTPKLSTILFWCCMQEQNNWKCGPNKYYWFTLLSAFFFSLMWSAGEDYLVWHMLCLLEVCCFLFALISLPKLARIYRATLCIAQTTPLQDVCPSVTLSVCHMPVFCRNGSTYHQTFTTIR